MTDEQGKPKGAAFVDFANSRDYEKALTFDGQTAPGVNRRLRINPASQKPTNRM